MAVNSISSSRVSFSVPDVQSANLRETRANRGEQRSEQAQVNRASQAVAAERAFQAVQKRVEQNADTQRLRAQQGDEASAAQRRHDAATAKQETPTLGGRINTKA